LLDIAPSYNLASFNSCRQGMDPLGPHDDDDDYFCIRLFGFKKGLE
jgi:hypothetical protein